jgi:hypothetical protein
VGNTFQIPSKDQEPVLTELTRTYGEMYFPNERSDVGLLLNLVDQPGCTSIRRALFANYSTIEGVFTVLNRTRHTCQKHCQADIEWH